MTAAVGADIESICTKCGDVWHVVVAKVGDRIAKVQCKQCNGLHRYKPPGGPVAAPRGAAAPRARRPPPPPPAPLVAADPGRPVRRYAPLEAYAPGDRINHPTFGLGVVESMVGPGKMQVFFPGGRRVLAQARAPGIGLEKRGPIPDD